VALPRPGCGESRRGTVIAWVGSCCWFRSLPPLSCSSPRPERRVRVSVDAQRRCVVSGRKADCGRRQRRRGRAGHHSAHSRAGRECGPGRGRAVFGNDPRGIGVCTWRTVALAGRCARVPCHCALGHRVRARVVVDRRPIPFEDRCAISPIAGFVARIAVVVVMTYSTMTAIERGGWFIALAALFVLIGLGAVLTSVLTREPLASRHWSGNRLTGTATWDHVGLPPHQQPPEERPSARDLIRGANRGTRDRHRYQDGP
jgi:hypothetical protein